MRITDEMYAEDDKRWHTRDVVTELGYCSHNMRDRRDITNLDIRFYAYIMRKAHEMLKAREPRVLSWEEVDKSGNLYVWTEIHSFYSGRGCLIYCTVVRSEFFDELFRLREDSGQEWARTEEDYNRDNYQGAHSGWRCWSARPTEEQRKAVLWDG